MIAPENHLPHRATFAPALLSGLKLCKVNGNKNPDVAGWNLPGNEITDIAGLPEYTNAGILLAPSNRATVDIDDEFMAQMMFAERGLNLQDFLDAPDAVQIISGRPGSGKLLYAMPEGMTLPSKSLKIGIKTIVEFRNSTKEGKTVQDVCPGSKHPSGTTYTWAGSGDWTNPPQLPAEILAWWQELLAEKHDHTSSGATTLENLEEVRSALEKIPASVCHDDWLEVIMALHSTGHADAYEVARQWSMTCPEKYPGDNTFNGRWRSFSEKANGITIASLFHHAKEHGWIAPPVDVTKLFDGVRPKQADNLFSRAFPIPELDINIIPPVLRDFSVEIGNSVGADPVVSISAGLIAASSAIDSRCRLEIQRRFKVPPILRAYVVGTPADKKSPASKPMFEVLEMIERDDAARYKMDVLRWEAEEAAYAAAKKDFITKAGDAEHAMSALGGDLLEGLPQLPTLRPAPVPKRLTTSDVTTAKLALLCKDRPEGLSLILDDGGGWLKKQANPNSCDDPAIWLYSYEGGRYNFDRVGHGSIPIEEFAMGMYVNVQPGLIKSYLPLFSTDGLMQRFMPFVLDGAKTSVSNPVPEWGSVCAAYEHAIRLAHAAGERHYTLTPEAHALFRQFEVDNNQLKRKLQACGYSSYLVAFAGKMDGLVGRVALVFHMLTDLNSPTVPASTMADAIKFVDGFLFRNASYIDAVLVNNRASSVWIAEHIVRIATEGSVTMSDIKRSGKRNFDKMGRDEIEYQIRMTMAELEKVLWVTLVEDNRKTTCWAINPMLVEMYREKREELIRDHAELVAKIRGSAI